MAEAPTLKEAPLNPCCKSWSDKCYKLLDGRKALRAAVKLLEEQVVKIQQEKASLQKECEEVRNAAANESEGKEKERSARMSLENEVSDLKSEISALHQRGSVDTEGKDKEIELLRDKLKFETSKLTELIQKEKKRADAEKKNAETEKRRAAEAEKRVKAEKAKAVEENKHADTEKKKAEAYRVQLEALKKQAEDINAFLISEKEEKARYSAIKTSLEDEVSVLKSEIYCLKKECEDARQKEKEYMLLKDRVSEGEMEIMRLSELLEIKRSTSDFAAKAAEAETKSATKPLRVNEEQLDYCACIDGKKVKKCLAQLEAFRKSLLGKEGLEKESAVGASLEMTISVLTSEISSLKKCNANVEDRNSQLMQDIDGTEHDTDMVEDHVEKQKETELSVDETGNLETEDALNIPEKSILGLEKEEDMREVTRRLSLEEEIVGLKSQIFCLQQKGTEIFEGEIELLKGCLHGKENQIKQLNELVDKVNLQLDSEKKKAEVQKKIADEACERLKAEMPKVVTESTDAISEAKNAEKFRIQLDCLNKDFFRVQSELDLEKEKYSKLKEELEVERQTVRKERQRVETEMTKAEDQRTLAEVNGKIAMREKARADELCCRLEVYKHKNEELQKHVQQFLHYQNVAEVPATMLVENKNIKLSKMKLLKKQLKLEKMQCKHAKQVAEFEKHRNLILQQELGNLRHDFFRISCRLDLLAKCFPPTSEGISDMGKDGALGDMRYSTMRRRLYDVDPFQMYSKKGSETFNASCRTTATTNIHRQPNTVSPVCAGDPSLSTSGIDSQLQSLHGGSNTKLSPHSSMHASSASSSDGGLVHSQDRVDFVPLSKKIAEDNSDAQPTFHMSAEGKSLQKRSDVSVHQRDRKDQVVFNAVESVRPMSMDAKKLHVSCVEPERLHKRRKLSPDSVSKPFHATDLPSNCKMIGFNAVKEPDAGKSVCPKDAYIRVAQAFEETVGSSMRMVPDTLPNFEDIADGDYLKLLELDDSDQEKIYKEAMDVPLSPTLPEISIFHEEPLTTNNIDMDLHCNESRGNGPKTSCEVSLHVPAVFITSSTEDSRFINTVFSATKACMALCAVNTQTKSMLPIILHAVGIQENISPKERNCVLFTLLLLNYSDSKLLKAGRILYEDLIGYVDSLGSDFQPVLSAAEGRSSVEEVCSLHELLEALEDFLINGTVVECAASTSETLNQKNSRGYFPSDKELKFSRKLATAEQLVVGGTLLASICASNGYIGFVCDTSYNILRKSRCDTAFQLTILHIFAHVIGKQYVSFDDCGLTMKVLRSIVRSLEMKMSLVASSTGRLPSENSTGLQFSCCSECPFGAVSVDIVTSVLLEKLWGSVDPAGTTRRMESKSPSSYHTLNCNEHKEGISQSNSIMNGTLDTATDALSLLELVSCKMGWEWTHSKIIPELLDMMEKPVPSTLQIALVVFLGQVGRVGVAASGDGDKGVESLTRKLSLFLVEEAVFPVQIAAVTSLLTLLSLDFEIVADENSNCTTITSQSAVIGLIRDWFRRLSKDHQTLSLSFLRSQR